MRFPMPIFPWRRYPVCFALLRSRRWNRLRVIVALMMSSPALPCRAPLLESAPGRSLLNSSSLACPLGSLPFRSTSSVPFLPCTSVLRHTNPPVPIWAFLACRSSHIRSVPSHISPLYACFSTPRLSGPRVSAPILPCHSTLDLSPPSSPGRSTPCQARPALPNRTPRDATFLSGPVQSTPALRLVT